MRLKDEYDKVTDQEKDDLGGTRTTPVSRREFLKMAGMASAAVGIGVALGGGLSACGDGTTTDSSTTTSTAAPSSTTTSVSASEEAGRAIKIGVVSPQTGSVAIFAAADDWWVKHAQEAVGDGLVLGDGKKHGFEFTVVDTQSDSNRAAQITGDLITNDQVDMVIASGTPDTVNPAADQAEAMATPFLGGIEPWQSFSVGRNSPAEGFKWTYGFLLGSEQTMACFIDCFNQISTNKVLGLLYANDADGAAFMNEETGAPAAFKAAGFTIIAPSAYQPGAEDYTQQISEFKKYGCEILCGINNPADFTNFWKQSMQQGFQPKLASSAKCLGWASVVEAMGSTAIGLLGEIGWHPTFPFKDSLTGMTCQQLADDFEQKMGQQWVIPISSYALFEWAVDALKRTTDIDSKEAFVEALKGTKMETSTGPIDFTVAVGEPNRPVPNVYEQPFTVGQWVKGTKWAVEPMIVSNAAAPMVEVQAQVQPMQYS